nr:TlpA disulfide reductase family protein [uncultured Carboxylicivirga sp.]
MKILSSLLLVLVLLQSCNVKQNQNSKTIICGKVNNYEELEEYNLVKLYVPDILDTENVFSEIILPDGTFRFEFDIDRPFDVTLDYIRRTRFYITPGDSLFVTIEGKHFINEIESTTAIYKAYQITGNGSTLANEVKNYCAFFEDSINSQYPTYDSLLRVLPPLEFSKYIDLKIKRDISSLHNYTLLNNSSDKLKKWAEDDIKQYNWFYKMKYAWKHPMLNGVDLGKFIRSMPESFYSFINDDNISLNHFTTNWFSEIVREMIVKIQYSVPQGIADSIYNSSVSEWDQINFNVKEFQDKSSGFIKDALVAQYLYHEIKVHNLKNIEGIYTVNLIEDEYLNSKLNKAYEKEKKLVEDAGSDNGNLSVKKFNNDFLTELVTQYQGKVIYIDFWAPWCGPCMDEMPYSISLKERVKDKDIVFVYAGCECTEDQWRLTIEEKGIKGENYLLEKKDFQEMAKVFGISGIPHFALINKEGEIIYANAPRPSNTEEIMEAFDEVLEL